MTGLSKRTFMELLGRYQVSVLNYPAEDIMQDFVVPNIISNTSCLIVLAY
jgi:hypothetical protein